MKNLNFLAGNVIPWTNTTGSLVPSGSPVVVQSGAGGMVGVAETDIDVNATGPLRIKEAVVTLTAITGTGKTFAQLDKLYFDGTKVSKVASGNTPCGRAFAAKGASTATAQVLLGPQ